MGMTWEKTAEDLTVIWRLKSLMSSLVICIVEKG